MGRIFYIMGKSASGKDTVYQRLLEDDGLQLCRIIPYTTRPIREGEEHGREYIFCDGQREQELARQGKIIEQREYHTVHGIWKYFTVDDGQIDLAEKDYLAIGTLEGYRKIREYYGKSSCVPIYIEVEDGERLLRAIAREKKQKIPQYEEMCRRFIADAADFSEEQLRQAGITERFLNETLQETLERIAEYIRRKQEESEHGNQGE